MRNFIVGSPLSKRDKAARLKALLEIKLEYLRASQSTDSASLERVAKEMALEREDRKIDRITDKSIGLMQVLALLMACVAFKSPANLTYTEIIIFLAVVAILLLLWNMLLISPRNPLDLQIDRDISDSMNINGLRALRLTISILMTGTAIVFWFASMFWLPAANSAPASHVNGPSHHAM